LSDLSGGDDPVVAAGAMVFDFSLAGSFFLRKVMEIRYQTSFSLPIIVHQVVQCLGIVVAPTAKIDQFQTWSGTTVYCLIGSMHF
jgi:hypothetical protein